jgi:drug/metabolite transporter (DMT)-like permease
MATQAKQTIATLVGGVAILLWSTLALFTTQAQGLPPFQLLSMCFLISFFASLLIQLHKLPRVIRSFRQPWKVWLLNVGGLFGYHFFYFIALSNAPAVQAGLIAYLWPLLIVLFSALLPGERLRWFHVAGGVISMLGAVLIVTKGGTTGLSAEYAWGYISAMMCAIIWAGYSITNRRFKQVPTTAVGGFCLVVAILGAVSHLYFEETVIPQGLQWLAIAGLGLGPIGLAFFVWDYGVKHGHIQLLGVLSYSAPLLSTLLLLAAGQAQWHYSILLACLLVIGGALLASLDILQKRVH